MRRTTNGTVALLPPGQAPTEQEALRWYVGAVPTGTRMQLVSSYHAVLGDARGTTGRDDAGAVTPKGKAHTGTWLGAVGYLSFLDQVGAALTFKGWRRNPARGVSVEWCLRDFAPHITQRDREAFYALRCSLAHEYSLFNGGLNRKKKRLDFHVGLRAERGRKLVEHAPRRWDGVRTAEPRASSRTWVNLWAPGDVAEGCHQAVQLAFRNGHLAAPRGFPVVSSTHVTQEIYTHVTPPMQSDAAERVAARIFQR